MVAECLGNLGKDPRLVGDPQSHVIACLDLSDRQAGQVTGDLERDAVRDPGVQVERDVDDVGDDCT